MPGVVIVDDEALSRMGLRAMLDWEKEGFCILGEAENGKKGLDLILRYKPEIVVTDIKMPVMDGLEMIHKARGEYDGARYVVLTSYEEFGLLKTAMNYGVTDYLLKLELSPELLRSVLTKQKEELERDTREPSVSPSLQTARALRRLLNGQDAEAEAENALISFNQDMDVSRLSCIAVRYSLANQKIAAADDRHTIETAVYSIVNNIVNGYFKGISFFTDNGICLFVYSAEADRCIGKVEEMCEVIVNMLRQYINVAASVGITDLVKGACEVRLVMEDAIRATDEVFFQGYGKILRSRQNESHDDGPIIGEWQETLSQALELRNPDKVREAFLVLNGMMSDPNKLRPQEAFNLCFSVAFLTLSILKKSSSNKGFFNENLYEIIGEIETLDGLRSWLLSFEADILELFESIPEKTCDDYIVTAAKRFIVENCNKQISLNMVAEQLSISSGYLSQIFKRKTSIGFVEYVTKTRISEAKRLLLSGKYKIYEVSQLVGFEDTSYFTKTFHKIVGFTPKEYIALHS